MTNNRHILCKRLKDLLNTGLGAGQIASICKKESLRLSTFGWSKYAVEDGILKLHYHFGNEEYTEDISSVYDLNFFDEDNVGDFEYSQTITADMIKALRAL